MILLEMNAHLKTLHVSFVFSFALLGSGHVEVLNFLSLGEQLFAFEISKFLVRACFLFSFKVDWASLNLPYFFFWIGKVVMSNI